ncbi:GntR family transcriptional regulator [Amycolatopsis sp. WQ 127309]|uniref:GntR family transcriptional regulator n=1 Tax=Amycolatopsis sp. WQ 127309 TaxID=2932773 RepID=UPI001FF3038E|nr:GntR family transcriptional regulator [Amycolatopsis sp. WQ 127309]UOZ02835.1 GntR family transcriptional regulator [Amycolatopsis sp. WQ 127309]
MAKRAGGESLAVMVYEQLRSAILNGDRPPGERLKPGELGEQYGVSLSVVREALGLLGAKDLVQVDRNRGFHVTPLSLRALNDLTEARVVNEGAALRLSVERGGVTWESEVLAAHHRLSVQPMLLPGDQPRRNEEWALAHLAFHRTLIEACGNAVLLDICARLSDAAEVYRAWSATGTRELHRDVAGEHKGLLDAALAHDTEAAETLFAAHVRRTQQILIDGGLTPAADRPATETA